MSVTRDPASHEAHDFPLARRIVEAEIRAWLDTHLGIAHAAAGSDEIRQGIDQARHLHLDNYSYTVVTSILDSLERAGLLHAPSAAAS